MIIAIDGTVAAGKGTLARRLSAIYGLPHMDTGRLYRATGLAAMSAGVDLDDADGVAKLALKLDPLAYSEVDLRSADAGQAASKVAVHPEVRSALLDLQRAFAGQPGGAVLDGRDIGTVVCPDADVKLWVHASIEARAERRVAELAANGERISVEDMIAQLAERDARDRSRRDAPARPADDAVLIDTTDLSIDAAVDKARAAIEAVLASKSAASRPPSAT